MATKALFDQASFNASRITTQLYSTSFSLGIRFLNKRFREPIYNIYGFVRFADEIVDTFHDFNKEELFFNFKRDTFRAIEQGISLNPILNSFQHTVNKYQIDHKLIHTFLNSMEMDLFKQTHSEVSYQNYILGSAEVVGLMCLSVFCDGNQVLYDKLRYSAMRLGSAFQKINFLRDLKEDAIDLNRMYFPELDLSCFDQNAKREIENDIDKDFYEGLEGIRRLPKSSRFGVYLAYVYYRSLFRKIKSTRAERVLRERIRVPDTEKIMLLLNSYVRHNLNLL